MSPSREPVAATTPAISIIIVTHNSETLIPPVLEALASDELGAVEVITVDSASEDATSKFLRDSCVELIQSPHNIGFATACHLGADRATGEILVFLGHDTVPREGWLPPLVAALDEPGVGAAMSTVEDPLHPGRFNTSGGHLTYFGMGWISDFGRTIPVEEIDLVEVAFPSGTAMSIRTATWDSFGGFRKPFFMYQEDADLGWRLRLAGLRIVRVPGSRVSHLYDFGRSPRKMYYLERNRWWMLRSNYRRSTLLLLSPALALVEIGVLLVSVRDRWLGEKLRALLHGLGNREAVKEGRRLVGASRSIGDGEMISTMDHGMTGISQVRLPRGTLIVDRLLRAWVRTVLPLIRIIDRLP